MLDISQFSKVAPYLVNPLVLIGFGLFLVFGTQRIAAETAVPKYRLLQVYSEVLFDGF
jgi:hypothetical protein